MLGYSFLSFITRITVRLGFGFGPSGRRDNSRNYTNSACVRCERERVRACASDTDIDRFMDIIVKT